MQKIPELISTTRVSEILGVSRKTIWAWGKEGIITPAAVTGSTRKSLLFAHEEVARMKKLLEAAEAEQKLITAEHEAYWERKRLERLEVLESVNPTGVSKAERLNEIEAERARKRAARVASDRNPIHRKAKKS